MDLRKIKTLIDLVADSGVAELEISEGEDKVRIVNSGHSSYALPRAENQIQTLPAISASPVTNPNLTAAPVNAIAPVTATSAPLGDDGSNYTVRASMVGTFYRSSTPGGKPFVELGQDVKEGETVCIIEAMKLLNEIETERGGKVLEILVENGQAVEYGQALFTLAV